MSGSSERSLMRNEHAPARRHFSEQRRRGADDQDTAAIRSKYAEPAIVVFRVRRWGAANCRGPSRCFSCS
jgi:hypothetical protein